MNLPFENKVALVTQPVLRWSRDPDRASRRRAASSRWPTSMRTRLFPR